MTTPTGTVIAAPESTDTALSRPKTPVLRRQLLDGWRGLAGWSLGIAAVTILYLPIYPSLQTPELTEMIESLPPNLSNALGFDQIATGSGYTQATFFGLLGFVLAVIACTAWGSQFIAGMEETGQLELTLAHTVGRVQYALESFATLCVRIAALAVVAYLLIIAMNSKAELQLSPGNLVAATLAWASLVAVSGTAALAVGALSGRRSGAIGAGAGVAALGYAFDAVVSANHALRWMTDISPYHWAFGEEPLSTGFDWTGLGLLWAASALLVVVTCQALARRDISG